MYRVSVELQKHASGSLGEREMGFSQTFTSVAIKQLDYELEISIA